MSNLQKLKEKLEKQKERQEDMKVVKVKKAKKTTVSRPTNVYIYKKFSKEEQEIRDAFKNILNKKFKEFEDAYKLYASDNLERIKQKHEEAENIEPYIEKAWKKEENEVKKKYALQSLQKGRYSLLKYIIPLSEELQDSFMKGFINQDSDFSKFYEKWSLSHAVEIGKYEKEDEEKYDDDKEVVFETILDEIKNKIKQYADSNEIKIDIKDSLKNLLKKIEPDKEKREELREEFLLEFYRVDNYLRHDNGQPKLSEEISISQLNSEIKELLNRSIQKRDKGEVQKIKKMTKKQLKVLAKNHDIKTHGLGKSSLEILCILKLPVIVVKKEEKKEEKKEIKKIKYVDEENQEIKIAPREIKKEKERKKLQFDERSCISEYKKYEWIGLKILSVYIQSSDGLSYNKNIFRVINKDKWYKPTRKFFRLQCSPNRKQVKTKLICMDGDVEITYKIVYEVENNDGSIRNILQNENMFNKELAYFKKIEENSKTVITLMDKPVGTNSIELAKYLLSSNLLNIVNDSEYAINSPFIEKAINSISHNTKNKDFFEKINMFITYLNLSFTKTLKNRIKNKYYRPEILFFLSPQELFPEESDIENNKDINTFIYSMLSKNMEIIKDSLLRRIESNVGVKRKIKLDNTKEPKLEFKIKRQKCINKHNIPDERIVIFGNYCFDEKDLMTQFEEGNYINSYTGKKFPDSFIHRYLITYYEPSLQQKFTFPCKVILDRIGENDFTIPTTNINFPTDFIQKMLEIGKSWNDIKNVRKREFIRFQKQLEVCQNPEDIENEPIDTVIFYEHDNNTTYCFPIPRLVKLFETEEIKEIQIPNTKEYFNPEFVSKIKSMYTVPKLEESIVKKQNSEKIDILIPNIWSLLEMNIEMYSKAEFKFSDEKEIGEEEEEINEEEINEEEKDDNEEDEDDNEEDEDDNEEDEDDNEEDEDDNEDEEDEEDEDDNEDEEDNIKVQENKENKDNKQDEKVQENKENKDNKQDDIKVQDNNQKCSKCSKPISECILKSTGYTKNGTVEYYCFCSLECCKKFKFAKY